MLRTFATALQHEARPAVSAFRHVSRRSLHVSRQCLNESSSPSEVPGVEASAEVKPKAKQTRAKKETREPKPKKQKTEKEPKPLAKSVLQEGKLLKQLLDIERPGQSISLEDVERYRPRDSEPDTWHPEYPQRYKLRLGELQKHFNRQQLYDILKLYDISRPGSHSPKKNFASLLLDKWGWPRPDSRDRTKVTQEFPLKMSEALLLLMHESSKFSEWRTSKKIKLRFTTQPLELHVEGYTPMVEELAAELRAIQQDIVSHAFSSPIKAAISNEELLQISRGCGAVAENLDDDQISISYFRAMPQTLEKAKRAILAAAHETTISRDPSLYYHVQDATDSANSQYALFPFSPVAISPVLPDNTPTFRIQSTATNVSLSFSAEEVMPVDTGASLGTLKGLDSSTLELQQWLHDLRGTSIAKLTVEALPGHIVVPTTGEKSFHFASPLPGAQELNTVLDLVRQRDAHRPNFYPFVPKAIFEYPSASTKSLQRLVYSEVSPSSTGPVSTLRCDLWVDAEEAGARTPSHGMVLSIEDSWARWRGQCEERTCSTLDVLLPDRATDLRFTASTSNPLKEDEFPETLKDFVLQMRDAYQQQLKNGTSEYLPSNGSPPLILYHRGKRFALTSYKNVRVNRKHAVNEAGKPWEVTTENIVGIDNNMTSGEALCKISCDPEATEIQWERFLKNCEWLTQAGVSKTSPPVFEEDIIGGLSM